MRCRTLFALFLMLFAAGTAWSGEKDVFRPAAPGAIRIEGWLGGRINANLSQQVMSQDIDRLVQPFRERTEENSGHWRCEYWGKWFTSAALACACDPTPDNRAVLDRGLRELLATQSSDGYIGTYKPDQHLGIWDVWGRKYTLLGLLADFDLTGNKESLHAAQRVADHLLQEAPPGKINLAENGIDVLKGLPSSSILEPIALLYQRTGDRRYLALADDIIANWSKPTKFFPEGPRLIEQGLAGTPPREIGARKAYEMMSCFEGVCEMYRITGERRYLESAVSFAQSIRRTEKMVHGSGSNQELWCDGTRTQTEVLEQPVETCVTVTWMKLCDQLLRLTGDSLWADELELSLYNSLLGAMTPDGAWWAYFSPLAGQRVPSHYQHADVQLSCCVANGPRGLLLTPRWAVMGSDQGVVVNLYAPGNAELVLDDGTQVAIVQQTDYPVGDAVTFKIMPAVKATFSVRFRIPAWSQDTSLTVNDQPVACKPGSYADVNREWSSDDTVVLKLDMRGRAVPAPSGAPQLALLRGPIVLALDNRLAPPQDVAVRLVTDSDGFVAVTPSGSKPDNVWMAFDVPFEVRPKHYFGHHEIRLAMCDYASAGNGWSSENLFRVWLPQPLFLRHMYPADTWRLMCPDLQECPTNPKSAHTITNDFKVGAPLPDVMLELAGDWSVEVRVAGADLGAGQLSQLFTVDPPKPVTVEREESADLEVWNPVQPGWARRKLNGLQDGMCSSRFALVPGSVQVTAADHDQQPFEVDKDFKVDWEWGAIGRLPEGRIGPQQRVFVSYQYCLRRLDSVVRTAANELIFRQGQPHISMPVPPALAANEQRIANIWLPAQLAALTPDNLFPILETAFPAPPMPAPSDAERLLPKTMAKLRSGERVKIVAWGDSVTEGYLGENQWQAQFVRRLKERFPKADISLVTVGWGAHNSQDFLAAPPGHARNYAETVLAARPDLVVSEFVNDGSLAGPTIERNYATFLHDFRRIGAEWIILTPHYHTFMGMTTERDLDEDPREYVKILRRFAADNGVAVADAASRYGRLWRQGIPYSTLMVNAANHPDARGMAIFADSLMAIFPFP